ncbi:MAG: sulfate adenylyltransferase [Phycisphaerales bacterium]|nr:sulfate adenylyltransferase [Phycisphaerales bacterium]
MAATTLITPHGGTLINRLVDKVTAEKLKNQAQKLPRITLSAKQACDLEMIAIGAFSPLTGFVSSADFTSICKNTRLANGLVWSIPITLAVDDAVKATLAAGGDAALYHSDGTLLAVIHITEIYAHDKALEIPAVFGTQDPAHPGVKAVLDEGNWLVAGPVDVITVTPEREPGEQFTTYRLTPAQTRAEFEKRNWKTVAAFQTRNPIHRAHEYLTKVALEVTDGLLIHPLVGETKPGDIPADVRMDCYRVLIDNYYNLQRTLLSVMPAAMRYAGPKEAILHALVRKNYGVTHFIVGRDHAGVGTYYGTYDAQKIFDNFSAADIGLTILKFENTFYCKKTKGMASDKTTNSPKEDRVFLSGTQARDLLKVGKRPPEEFSRPEVADILIAWAQAAEKQPVGG